MEQLLHYPLTKEELLLDKSLQLQAFMTEKLNVQNFEFLFEISDEAADFMKGFLIKDIKWVENYHWGDNAYFNMEVEYKEKVYLVEGAWLLYAYPMDGDSYVIFDSNRTDELFAGFLHEFGLEDLLMKIDGHNWEPFEDDEDELEQQLPTFA